jgi:hypothetical protein
VHTEPVDDAGEPAREGIDLVAGHRGEERARKPPVVALELGDERLAARGQRHQSCPTVGRVQFARHQAVGDERVDEACHGPRRHLQRAGKNALLHGASPSELPQQVRSGRREPERLDRVGHVVVEHEHELQDAIEEILVLLYLLYSEE